jgi:hypothetical protein
MIFELHGQFITRTAVVTAEARNGGLVVSAPQGICRARDLTRAIRIACDVIGPLMEAGDKAGEGWGLLVVASSVSVAYGNWPAGVPREPGPELELLRRIVSEYRPGDGARAALRNAAKVIEAYADQYHPRLGRAA